MKKTVDKIPFYRLGWNKSYFKTYNSDKVTNLFKTIILKRGHSSEGGFIYTDIYIK
jgi:hypothetical protein